MPPLSFSAACTSWRKPLPITAPAPRAEAAASGNFVKQQAEDVQRSGGAGRGAGAFGSGALLPDGEGVAEILLAAFRQQLVTQLLAELGHTICNRSMAVSPPPMLS